MKTFTALLFAPLALAGVLAEHQHMSNMDMESAASPIGGANSTGGATCGVGYTYCGYILKEQKRESPPRSPSRIFYHFHIQHHIQTDPTSSRL